MNELSTYLSKATKLLHDYQWIYNFQATHILVNGIFSHIPEVWIKALLCLSDDDLKLLTAGILKDGWASCILEFIQKYHELTLPSASEDQLSSSASWEQIPDKLRKGMSPKKQHEVLHLASFIYQQCNYSQISRILDLGSGLGYLGKLLHHKSGYRVLGLEADAGHVVRAVRMQQPICSSGVNHMALTLNPAHKKEGWNVTVEDVRHALEDQNNWIRKCSCGQVQEEPDSSSSVEESSSKSSDLENKSPSKLQVADNCVCMVSLHSCGDLSPTAMRLFLQLPETRLLILLACCYHKMKTLERTFNPQMEPNPTSSSLISSLGEDKSVSQVKEVNKIPYNYLYHESIGNSDGGGPVNDSSNQGAALNLHNELGGESNPCKSETKMIVSWEEESFPDFPMSKLLRSLVPSSQKFLKRPLLRLASEITVEMWRLMTPAQHDEHAIHVMGRAVLELYALKG
ncbi:hypothetical protein J437_LFUL000666 [Ladona fulva]|uniref:Methyltransferase domain-containing protein n=1 Tax=Ladona fulva TaxID=123851 RepID=A0A8K0K3B8_LADFU|nr:hypothetical protein J437_LFUL000666 [Ladona fulva]